MDKANSTAAGRTHAPGEPVPLRYAVGDRVVYVERPATVVALTPTRVVVALDGSGRSVRARPSQVRPADTEPDREALAARDEGRAARGHAVLDREYAAVVRWEGGLPMP
jgi:hypothetical protein